MNCPKCGAYNNDKNAFCGNCGSEMTPESVIPQEALTTEVKPEPVITEKKGRGFPIFALIFSIVALVCSFIPYVAIFAIVLAVIFCGIALAMIPKNDMYALPIVSTFLTVLAIALFIVMTNVYGINYFA